MMSRHSVLALGGLFLFACQLNQNGKATDSDLLIVNGNTYSSLPAVGLVSAKGVRCTGTLIAPQKVVTAAHCLTRVAHVNDLSFIIANDAARPHFVLKVSQMESYPSYSSKYFSHDIAVLTLHEPAPASIAPIPLHTDLDPSWLQQRMFAVGFGYTDGVGQKGSGVKRAVWLPMTALSPYKILSQPDDGASTCGGDSGGPALHMNDKGDFTLVGVTTSSSNTKCQGNSIFARVDPYRRFIEEGSREQLIPADDPCPGFADDKQCSDDGTTPRAEGRFSLSCKIDPWLTLLKAEDCQSKGEGFTCRRGICSKPSL